MSNFKIWLSAALLVAAGSAKAQITTPQPSPLATITQKIGLIEAKVEYSRPSVKGRKIFGDVVPFDQLWRTGANSSTKITFSDSVSFGGTKIAGGTYALYTKPGAKEWTVILGKTATEQAWDYKEGTEAAKIVVPIYAMKEKIESFMIMFENLERNQADLMLAWENTLACIPIKTNPDAKIMADIKKRVVDNNDNMQTAANYYFDNNKDLKQALEWANKVVEKNPAYWNLHLKAKILAKMGNCNEAQAAAKQSLALAEKDEDGAYVTMNKNLIAACPMTATPAKGKKK